MVLFVLLLHVVRSEVSKIDAIAEKYAVESGKRVSVKVEWNAADAATFYRIFQRKENEEWQIISTFDEHEQKRAIKVLNAFPSEHASSSVEAPGPNWVVKTARFVYADGTVVDRAKSSALKVWMEGGSIDGVQFNAWGRDPETNDLFVEVDVIPIDDLNLEPKMIWNYDVVVFGTWERLGARDSYKQDCNFPKANLIEQLKEYLSAGYSVIASHDSIGFFSGSKYGLGQIRSYFGIKVGGREGNGGNDLDANNVEMKKLWAVASQKVEIVKNGHLVNFPWSFPNQILDIMETHTYGNIATGDVWMRLINEPNRAFEYTFPGGDIYYYLTTRNNTAMIQTGHSQCNATEAEQQIWANLIVSMKQRTTSTRIIDHYCIDEDNPFPPVCECSVYEGKYSVKCNAQDAETRYEYRIEGYSTTGSLVAESLTSVNASSGIDHFLYHIDTKKTMDLDELLTKTSKALLGDEITGSYSTNQFLHILTMDGSGNPSDVTDFPLSKCVLTTHEFKSSARQKLLISIYSCFYVIYTSKWN